MGVKGLGAFLANSGSSADMAKTAPAAESGTIHAELARRASRDILELACGSGQLTVPLASAGLHITGLDLSEPMLSAARGARRRSKGIR